MKKLLIVVRIGTLFLTVTSSLLMLGMDPSMDTSEDPVKKSTKRSLKDDMEESASKRQKLDDPDKERKVSAAAAVLAKPGIQDTLINYIKRDATGIVKSYLGWKKESHDIRKGVNLSHESSRWIQCCALGRDDQHNPLVYACTDDIYRFDTKTRTLSVVSKMPCSYMSGNDFGRDRTTGRLIIIPPRKLGMPIHDLVQLSSEQYVVHAMRQIVAVNKGVSQEICTLPASDTTGRFSSLLRGTNKMGKPVLFCTYFNWINNKDEELITPKLTPITFSSDMRIFLSNCRTPSGSDNACVGKSKNGDCIAYQIAKDNSIIVFNLETGTLKTTFKVNPKTLKSDKGFCCSANNEGHVAIGNCTTGCVSIYDEDGALIKEFTVPQLDSIDLVSKGRCIVGDENGILRSYDIKSDEIQEIGAISPRTTGADLINRVYAPMIVSVNHDKPTTIVTINKDAVVDLFTDEAEAIEEFDRIGFAKSY